MDDGLDELVGEDIEAVVGTAPGQVEPVSVLDCTHLSCYYYCLAMLVGIHLVVAGGKLVVASHPH